MKPALNGNTSNATNPINKKLWILWVTIFGTILATIAFIINYIQGTFTVNTTIDLVAVFITWLLFTSMFSIAALVDIFIHKKRFK
jgi:uncharacterized membrane protein